MDTDVYDGGMTLLAASGDSGGGNILGSVIPIVLLIGVFYLFILRPQRRRAQAQKDTLTSLHVGDEVLMAGGLMGQIAQLDDTTMLVEVAPGVTMRFITTAVAKVTSREDEVPRGDEVEPDYGDPDEPDASAGPGDTPQR